MAVGDDIDRFIDTVQALKIGFQTIEKNTIKNMPGDLSKAGVLGILAPFAASLIIFLVVAIVGIGLMSYLAWRMHRWMQGMAKLALIHEGEIEELRKRADFRLKDVDAIRQALHRHGIHVSR